jgi:hypothetical protein
MTLDSRTLIHILDTSIKRHGPDKPVTLAHLRNIIAMAARNREAQVERQEEALDQLAAECTVENQ